MIAIDLSKQQAFNGYPKAIQQINFTGNLDRVYHSCRTKRDYFRFFTSNCESILILFFALR